MQIWVQIYENNVGKLTIAYGERERERSMYLPSLRYGWVLAARPFEISGAVMHRQNSKHRAVDSPVLKRSMGKVIALRSDNQFL